MKNKNIITLVIMTLVAGGVGSAVVIKDINNNNVDINSKNNINTKNSANIKKETVTNDSGTSASVNFQSLAVDPLKCIGCGKCARIDSEHFEMNGRTAAVISSKNLTSQNLAMAIRACPADAINLN